MKTFNASDLSKKPSEVWAAARKGGAIIQHKDRQGKVVGEFVIKDRQGKVVGEFVIKVKGDL
tara:strand:+ start:265 stop:450 length:186 start_codon:yes stop_codon:yes gene_type:complete